MKLLIVDDDPDICRLFAVAFGEAGYEVTTAEDGLEALRKTKQVQPDAVLMDLMMPRMNGYIATRMIKTDPDLARITVIALTAVAPAPRDDKLKEMGFSDYCIKPIRPTEIVERVNRILHFTPHKS